MHIGSGLGVRIGVYLQAFLCVLNVLLREILRPELEPDAYGRDQVDASVKSLDEIAESGVVALFTIVALIISAFIDAAKYHRLEIYHATITCYICGMLLLSAVAPVVFAAGLDGWLKKGNADNYVREKQIHVHRHIPRWSVACGAAQIGLGVFGLWINAGVASHPYDRDTTVANCTRAWFMGANYIIGVEGPWKRMWIAFYAVLTIPLVLPLLVLFVNGVVGALILYSILTVAIYFQAPVSENSLSLMWRLWRSPSFSLGITLVLLCITTEMTVRANHVNKAEKPWGQGQVFPILIASFPAYRLWRPLQDLVGRGVGEAAM